MGLRVERKGCQGAKKRDLLTADHATGAAARVGSGARGTAAPEGSHEMSSTQKLSRGAVAANACATASANGRGSGYELTGTPSTPRQRTTDSGGRRSSLRDRRLMIV